MSGSVLVELSGRVATIYLNEPQSLNALSTPVKEGLLEALLQAKKSPDIRSIVLTGKGRSFCSGGDVKEMRNTSTPAGNKRKMDNSVNIITLMQTINKPIIAAVKGYAAGAGFSIALASDLIIAEEDAKFSLAFSRVGFVPDFGAHFNLLKFVSPWKAKELIWSAEVITAREGQRLGFVNKVAVKGQVEVVAQQWAEKLADGPTIAYGFSKDIINQAHTLDMSQVLELENFSQSMLKQTKDHKEAVEAFAEKRAPNFTGE